MSPSLRPPVPGLFLDLYELTMVDAYLAEGLTAPATFSLFARRLPPRRNFLLAAGLGATLDALARLRFSTEALEYLEELGIFSRALLHWLERFEFRGAVRAIAEGTPFFPDEPLLEVTAPLPEAQLVESVVMNQVALATAVASKAARMVEVAHGRVLVDFGLRRAQGLDAALIAARAAYLAGFTGTSNVLAGQLYGIPVSGTMAHSYVQAHATELEAFRAFVRHVPNATLLVDTYDTLEGVRQVVRLSRELGELFDVRQVRLDSGDLGKLAAGARRMLDNAGLRKVGIVASGGLDEDQIAALVQAGAPIDGFGVGTSLVVSDDAPALDLAYKLVGYAGEGRMKLSTGKRTHPFAKQVFRIEQGGLDHHDVLGRTGEDLEGRRLLDFAMQGGARTGIGAEPLERSRQRAREELAKLPAWLRALGPADRYPVWISEHLVSEESRLAQGFAPSEPRGPSGRWSTP